MDNNTRQRIGNILLCVTMTVMMLAALLPLLKVEMPWLRYAFAAGAAGTLVAQLLIPSPNNELRVKRLSHMNVWSAIVYCVSAYCLFSSNYEMQRSWIAFLLAGAVLQIYATAMLAKLAPEKPKK